MLYIFTEKEYAEWRKTKPKNILSVFYDLEKWHSIIIQDVKSMEFMEWVEQNMITDVFCIENHETYRPTDEILKQHSEQMAVFNEYTDELRCAMSNFITPYDEEISDLLHKRKEISIFDDNDAYLENIKQIKYNESMKKKIIDDIEKISRVGFFRKDTSVSYGIWGPATTHHTFNMTYNNEVDALVTKIKNYTRNKMLPPNKVNKNIHRNGWKIYMVDSAKLLQLKMTLG